MSFRHDMSNEKAPKRSVLIPEGWRHFKITAVKEDKSKRGNDMFVFTVLDTELNIEDEVYALSTEGKRWFLKQILNACNVEEVCGVYDWEEKDVVNKQVLGLIVHEPNEFTDRAGNVKKTTQHKFSDFKSMSAWEEESR